MKYMVTGYASAYIEVSAASPEEAEEIGRDQLRLPQYWDYFEAEECEEEDQLT